MRSSPVSPDASVPRGLRPHSPAQDLPTVCQKLLTRRRQRNAPVGSRQQPRANLLFKGLDLLA